MNICGLQKTTLLDYPGYVASTIFLSNCNFRCPFCYNMNLVLNAPSLIEEKEIFSFLESRKGILDGVCITGGEPTVSIGLIPFIQKIKSLGYLVKLDTNGYLPNVLDDLLHMHLLDYIAMDIKASPSDYCRASGLPSVNISFLMNSIQMIINAGIPHEFRTTVIKEFHNLASMKDIGTLISGADAYYLQSFIDSNQVTDHSLHACTKEELLAFVDIVSPYVKKVELRGID